MRVGLFLYSLALLSSSAAALHGQARAQLAGVARAPAAAPAAWPRTDLPVALAPGRDSVTAPSVAAASRAEGAVIGALIGAAAGGVAAYLLVKTQSPETQEWETLIVLYGTAIGALVGLLVGAVAAG